MQGVYKSRLCVILYALQGIFGVNSFTNDYFCIVISRIVWYIRCSRYCLMTQQLTASSIFSLHSETMKRYATTVYLVWLFKWTWLPIWPVPIKLEFLMMFSIIIRKWVEILKLLYWSCLFESLHNKRSLFETLHHKMTVTAIILFVLLISSLKMWSHWQSSFVFFLWNHHCWFQGFVKVCEECPTSSVPGRI